MTRRDPGQGGSGAKTPTGLLPQHAALISASAISAEVAAARGYRSVAKKAELGDLGFVESQRQVPTLLVPIWTVNGEIGSYQHRPDQPRIREGKPVKYETLAGSRMVLDIPPMIHLKLGDPRIPLFLTEGVRKADAAVSRGLCCLALLGVWNWRGTNEYGGKVALADWESIALNGRHLYIAFDSDVMLKPPVHLALTRLKAFLESRHAKVAVIYLPPGENGQKVGLDDFFAAGHTVEELQGLATRELREPPNPEPGQERLPTIEVGGRRLSEKTADALAALRRANDGTLRLFQQGGALIRLRLDDEGGHRMEPLAPDGMRGELDRVAEWVRTTNKGPQIIDPPLGVVKDVLALPSYELPKLRGIATAPFFTREGQLVVEAGYHPNAGLYLDLRAGFSVRVVPATPSLEDVRRARALIDELFCDFPFIDPSSRAHAAALLMVPFVREMIDGPTPLHGIDAPVAGTGKGLLADLASRVATGQPISVMSDAKDDEELRKRITSLLLEGRPFALFDNIIRRVAGGPLAALLTAETWSDRVLGVSKMVRLAVRATWIATGNNLKFSRELARRTVWIRMDAKIERPWARAEFKHHPIRAWVHENRAELVWAVLVLAQHWIAEGRPPFRTRTLGSFESWAEVIGGILNAGGVEGFLANTDAFHARADAETADWSSFIEAWAHAHANKPVTVAELFPLAIDFSPEVLGDGTDRAQRTRLGRALAQRVDWTIGGRRIIEAKARDDRGRERTGYALEEEKAAEEERHAADSNMGGWDAEDGAEDFRAFPNTYGRHPNVPTSDVRAGDNPWGEL
jgi:uncharacterized protein DUF3854